MFEVVKEYFMNLLLNNDIFSGALFGGGLLSLFYYVRVVPDLIKKYLLNKYTISFSINSQDDLYKYFHVWLSKENFDTRNKKFYVLFKSKNKRSLTIDSPDNGSIKKGGVTLGPYAGKFLFKSKNKYLYLDFTIKEPDGKTMILFETITISYLGTNKKYMNDIITEVLAEREDDIKEKTQIYISDGSWWESSFPLKNRKLSSVILRNNAIYNIKEDILDFMSKEEWYRDIGIPYHRGYLFHGKPGTGKTSAAYALASELNKDLYYLNLNSCKEEYIDPLFSKIDDNSILIMEDIDAIFVGRKKTNKDSVSFGTLINLLDGILSKDGLILIMTTNHVEKLDKAFIRPGRVDVKLEFTYCYRDQIEKIFFKFYGTKNGKKFSNLLPENKISPAKLQEYFISNKTEEMAFENVKQILNK